MKPVKLDDLTQDALDQLSVRSYALLSKYYKEYYGHGFCDAAFVVYAQEEAD